MEVLRRLAPFVANQKRSIAFAYICVTILNITTAMYAALSGPALAFVFSGDFGGVMRSPKGDLRPMWQVIPADWVSQIESLDASQGIWVLPIFLVLISVIKGFAQTGQFFMFGRISQNVLRAVREKTFSGMIRQSPDFFQKHQHGDLLSRLNNDSLVVEQAFFRGYFAIVRDGLAVAALLFYIFYSDPKLATLTFITVPLAALPLIRFSKWLKKVSKRGQAALGDISSHSYEALAGVRVVQSFGAEKREEKRFSEANFRYLKQMLVSYFIRAARTPTMETLGAIALAGLIGLMGYMINSENADPAHYVSLLGAVILMYDPIKRLGLCADHIAQGEAAAERLLEIWDHPPTIQDSPSAVAKTDWQGRVHFDDIDFAYGADDSGPIKVLKKIQLTIEPGEILALVGPSGGGKSTLANLLPRFYDVSAGKITIDDVAIGDITLASLRRHISMVSQETFLFRDTIAANIAYGNPDATADSIQDAARAAHAHEFIMQQQDGYDTVLGERGEGLSGGQRQRLAIARALLQDAPILVLDEATSALDIESERHVQAALEELMRGRTSLVIAHRLSTIRNASKICVLKDGVIVEMGSHEELLKSGGEYSRLYELQFHGDDSPRQAHA